MNEGFIIKEKLFLCNVLIYKIIRYVIKYAASFANILNVLLHES